MEALHSIQNFLKGRPKSFKSMDHAIEWRWGSTALQVPGDAFTHSIKTTLSEITMKNQLRPNLCWSEWIIAK